LKRLVAIILLFVALGLVYLVDSHHFLSTSHVVNAQAKSSGQRKVLYWYDEMEPTHHYNQPGKAPDGMDLVPQYADQNLSPAKAEVNPSMANMTDMPMGTVVIAPDKQTLAGVRTTLVERKPLTRDIRTTAQIVADETRIAHVHVKVSGYIDQVQVDFVGQLVKKGQPLFTLYSPELVSTEEEYLIAKRGNATLGNAPFKEIAQGARSLFESTRQRLKLWDITDDQIKELDQTGKVSKELTFYSPITGFVTDRKAFPQTSVTPETELYTVSDLSTVWADVDVFEYEVPYVHLGQHVSLSMSYYPGKTYTGPITYIYPTVDPQTRTVKVRIQIANQDFALKPQMFADAQILVNYGTKVVVPQESVLDSGTAQQVFVVHPGGVFEPRKVTLGPAVDGSVAILSGLKAGETVVTAGNFLIDAESQLKGAMSNMQH